MSVCVNRKVAKGFSLYNTCSHLHFLKDFNTCNLLIGSTSDYWIVTCLLLLLKLCSKSLSKTASRIFLTFLFLKCQYFMTGLALMQELCYFCFVLYESFIRKTSPFIPFGLECGHI